MKNLLLAALLSVNALPAFANANFTSWLTSYSGQYARIYTTSANRTGGTSVTTWGNQGVPAYADIAQVLYSASWVYVRASDLPSYITGPWNNPQGNAGNFSPTNQHLINRFPRTSSVPATKTSSGTGYSGLYVDGVAVFNFTDGKAWDPTNLLATSGTHISATYYWHRNAPVGESYNFDYGLGHQNPQGVYHTHQQPLALRYQLGDHVDYNSSTKNYSESSSTNLSHSPIVGWAYDGYPIYGPYGYSISNNAASGVRRMVSGYVKRDGSNGTDNLTNNLTTIPAWYARYRQTHFSVAYNTTTTQSRPAVAGTNTLGVYAQDFSHYSDLTNAATSQLYVPDTNTFDLDVYNGRYCVTPEFPGGTYAYFLTIDASSAVTYPYAIAFEYYGSPTGGSVSSISEAVTTNFLGQADAALTQSTPNVNTNYGVTLTWNSTEGGTYLVESSTNNSTWTTQRASVAASVGVSSSTTFTNPTTSGTSYARVTRTALASYDATGGGTGVVGQTNVVSFLLNNTAPVVANAIANQTATYGAAFSFTFATNVFTDADSGQTLTYTSSSALTNTGIGFNAATRTFSATTVDATNSGTIVGSYTVSVVATDDGSPAKSATNNFTLTINQAVASVSPNSFTRVYGGQNPTLAGTLSNFVAADSITANYFTTANTNSGGFSVVPITVTLTDPGTRLGNYLVTTNAATLSVTQAVVTVTAASLSRSYGATNPTFTVSYVGFTNAQTLATSGTSGSPTLTTTALTNSAIGSYAISNVLGTLQADNYTFKLVNGTLTVTPAALTVSANSTNRSYGAANPIFSGTLSGVVAGDAITASFGSSATTNSAPGNYSITPSLTDPGSKLGNYSVTTNTGTLTISQAVLTVSANFTNRTYGATNPIFTATYSGFVNGQTLATSGITGSPSLTCSATTNTGFGTYTISASIGTLASANYAFQFSSGLLTLNQAAVTVTANNFSRATGTTNPVFTASYTGFVNGQTLATSGAIGTPALTCAATTNSAAGSYVITNATGNLFAPNYSFTLANGTLTVTNVTVASFSATVSVTNGIVAQAVSSTVNYIFSDAASGQSITVALTMTPYSASNASPTFSELDYFGALNRSVHLGVNSGIDGGDGNFVAPFEGANFSATLVSASSGVVTNTVKFGIAGIGFRFSPAISWNSSVGSRTGQTNVETIYALDASYATLSGTNYTAQLRTAANDFYQLSDDVNAASLGLVLTASFGNVTSSVTGTNATLAAASYTSGQFNFTVTGTTGASYIVQTATNLVSPVWLSVATNTAPFTFTDAHSSLYSQRFYRVQSAQ